MFPKIQTLFDLVPHIEHDPQIRVKVEPNGFTVVCYMLQDEDTFTSPNYQFARECRGITFAPDGRIAARTLHKFFNAGENAQVDPSTLPWDKVARVMEKRDGSMVTPVLLNPKQFKFKTKKSFDTPEASLADTLAKDANYQLWILHLLQAGLTPTFEITSPKFPIVVLYEKDELTLLHIRDMETGRYLTEREVQFLNPPMAIVRNCKNEFTWTMGCEGVPTTQEFDWPKMKAAAASVTGLEGWIVQFENGDMVKVKTQWYVNLHHSVTFTRWRDVARAVLADQADDLKGAFAMTGRSIKPIEFVSQRIKQELFQLELVVELVANVGRAENLSVKDMALKFKDHELFGLIMREFRNQEINWTEYYERHFLDSWSLQVIPTDGTINEQDAQNLQSDLA